ncbi:hypothetical protein B7494_g27 [Chlorociboria aeruginascens]|nr:hypothetical protein B7494_g27 [Chlorociboria aeruginascens]
MPPQKRSGSDEMNSTPNKQPKAEHPEEFSNAVKKKLQSSSRTGQACDRCKIRKIRCDGLPGGCSPCLQNNTECRTTDRITGRATSRGYVEGIEEQLKWSQAKIRELEERLVHVDLNQTPGVYRDPVTPNYGDSYSSGSTQSRAWNNFRSANLGQNSHNSTNQSQGQASRPTLTFRAGSNGGNYLGVSPADSSLSSIRGTALSILGMEIDIAAFDAPEMDEPDSSVFHPRLYNKSYQSFLQSALNINIRIGKVDLPSRQEGLTFADWYFRALHPYNPFLHPPTVMRVMLRMYDDPTFKPSPAETVIIHMIFALMLFQYAVRNFQDSAQQSQLHHQSNMHYHYSLSMFHQLMSGHKLEHIQALSMINLYLRAFPKPGASWILTQITMASAVELGLHRSVKNLSPEVMPNPLEIELRKRTFYCLFAVHVTISGKLGRPMNFRLEDFDVEMPEAMDDLLLSEDGLDTSVPGKCLHLTGIQVMKIGPLFLELYSTIYAVRRSPETYIATVNNLESKLRAWKDGLPPELAPNNHTDQENRVFQLYCSMWALEFRLLLRHPSVSLTNDKKFNAESLRICVECSRQMLSAVRQIQKLKSFDTTWYNTTVYVMAITTSLFGQWENRSRTSSADLTALRAEMELWLDIMGEVGLLLGSGTHLRDAVKVVTDGTLSLLSRDIAARTTARVANSELKSPTRQAPTSKSFSTSPQTFAYPRNDPNAPATSPNTYLSPDSQVGRQQTPYPAATQYSSYPDGNTNSTPLSYTSQDNHNFHNYAASSDSAEAPLLAAFANQASQAASQSSWQQRQGMQNDPSSAWAQWTSTMSNGIDSEDCYSAEALMQLGTRNIGNGEAPHSSASMAGMTAGHALDHTVVATHDGSLGNNWPLNIFDVPQGQGGNLQQ